VLRQNPISRPARPRAHREFVPGAGGAAVIFFRVSRAAGSSPPDGGVIKLRPRSLVSASAVILAATTLLVCGKSSPSTSTAATPPPTTVAPATQPSAPPTTCSRLGYVSPSNNCVSDAPSFQPQLEKAMDQLLAQHPEIFNFAEASGGGQYRVRSSGRYYVGLIQNLEAQGVCAGFDGEELQVKTSNSFNDQFQVLTSAFFMRRGKASYRSTCTPAVFPTPPPPFPPNNGCPLPGSLEITCDREDQEQYHADIDRAIDKVAKEHPEIFDFNAFQPGTDWWGLVDHDKYFDYMVQAMISFGYCSRWDGVELVVKKTNDFSEHYAIWSSIGFIRRGPGSYRSSCFPAAF